MLENGTSRDFNKLVVKEETKKPKKGKKKKLRKEEENIFKKEEERLDNLLHNMLDDTASKANLEFGKFLGSAVTSLDLKKEMEILRKEAKSTVIPRFDEKEEESSWKRTT
jgi:hypothetical protein